MAGVLKPIGQRRGKMNIKFERWGKVTSYLGRFGGGWNYVLGVSIGHRNVILNLLFGSIRISWGKK